VNGQARGSRWGNQTLRGCFTPDLPDHLVLALEPLAARASWAIGDGTEMWTFVGMDVCVTVEEILSVEWDCGTAGMSTFEGCGEKAVEQLSVWWWGCGS
jgi:hypothetical protein